MKVLIVSSSFDAPGAISLTSAALSLGHDARIVKITDENVGTAIAAAERVIYRIGPTSYPLYSELLTSLSGVRRDELTYVLAAFDKLETYKILKQNDIATPFSQELERNSYPEQYPVVAKILNGNQGVGIALIHSREEYEAYRQEFLNEEKFLVQEFIEESSGVDTRLFVVAGKLVAAMKRVAETGDFRANLHLGARVEKYEPSEEEVALAVRAANAFKLIYAGVDIISSTNGPLVLEVNPSPGFGIQEVSDIDIASEVVKGVIHD